MALAVQPKPADSQEGDSELEKANTLAYLAPRPRHGGEGDGGSGVRKIDSARREDPHIEPVREEHVGPYRLIECIGEGAMGHVYRAEHTLIGRVVGIKMLRAELTGDEACVRRFLAEARAVNLIKHPHVIDVTDYACTEHGQPWFVMEMLEGSDLSAAALLEPLSLRRTLEIVRQVCEALAAVHAAGIVHRDVKPENIFLQQRDGKDFVTLLDFGIARLPDPANADPRQEGLVGTPFYMAPEQASARPFDHRADLYAVGSTLFELVAGIGRTPFCSESLETQLLHVMTTPAPRLSERAEVPASVRADLDRLVARLLAKDPSKRPSSAREVARELGRIAVKLDPPLSRTATATATLRRLHAMVPRPRAIEWRKRASRAARMRNADTARWAMVLAAIATAIAVWLAIRQASWEPVDVRASGSDDGAMRPSSGSEHIVKPLHVAPDTATPPAAQPESQEPTAQADQALPAGKSANASVEDSDKRDRQRARRASRGSSRGDSDAKPKRKSKVDRNVVLNPFER